VIQMGPRVSTFPETPQGQVRPERPFLCFDAEGFELFLKCIPEMPHASNIALKPDPKNPRVTTTTEKPQPSRIHIKRIEPGTNPFYGFPNGRHAILRNIPHKYNG